MNKQQETRYFKNALISAIGSFILMIVCIFINVLIDGFIYESIDTLRLGGIIYFFCVWIILNQYTIEGGR